MDNDCLDDVNNQTQAIKIQEYLDKIDLKRTRFLTIQDYFRALETNSHLKELFTKEFMYLPEKIIKANAAKVF